ncbi:MAG: serine/threonine-protein kinase [Polyangiaceae bacterium]
MSGPNDDLQPGDQIGPYIIEGLLGTGGMATVYLAFHQRQGKRMAVKMLRPQFAADPACVERFLQEARAASTLRHRHVIEVFDVNVESERPYLAMEYLQGETLADRLLMKGRLSVTEISDVLLPVISAVSTAHAAGIIHRDLKPDNVLIAREPGGDRPVLLDFGISKVLEGPQRRALTVVGQVVGTPYYMAPEQIRAEELDGRSDVYALGVMLYECATGVRPFRAEQSVFVLMAEILLGQPRPPAQIEGTIPPNFEAIILRALAVKREDRFASADALGRVLLSFASPSMGRKWARTFGADPDAIEPIVVVAPPVTTSSLPPAHGPSALADSGSHTLPLPGISRRGEALTVAELRAMPGLADFTDAELSGFCLVATGRRFAAGSMLFQQGTTGDACYAIVSGAVEILKDLNGAETVLDVLRGGSFVGQDALAERAHRGVSARALEDTLVIELTRDEMQRMLGFHDQVALRLLELIAVTGIRKARAATKKLAKLLEMRAAGMAEDSAASSGTRPLEWLRAAAREWSVRIDER